MDNFEGLIMSLVSKLPNVSSTPLVSTPLSDIGSNSINFPTHLDQNLNTVFGMTSILHSPRSILLLLPQTTKLSYLIGLVKN